MSTYQRFSYQSEHNAYYVYYPSMTIIEMSAPFIHVRLIGKFGIIKKYWLKSSKKFASPMVKICLNFNIRTFSTDAQTMRQALAYAIPGLPLEQYWRNYNHDLSSVTIFPANQVPLVVRSRPPLASHRTSECANQRSMRGIPEIIILLKSAKRSC